MSVRKIKKSYISCTGYFASYKSYFSKNGSSIRYVASKNKKEFMKALKLIYQAISKEAAEVELEKMGL